MLKKIRGSFRFIIFISLVLFYMLRYMLKTIGSGRSLDEGLKMRHKFAHWLPRLTGMNIEFEGKPSDKAAIYIGNHRTYYDPGAAAMHLERAVVVAKIEIADWPLLGHAADLIGVIFVDRENKDSRAATREAMAKALADGYSIMIFPEGTTGDHQLTLPFKPGTFATAIKMGVPIIPMAIEYGVVDDAWVDRSSAFVPHLINFWGKKRTTIKVRYGEPIYGTDVLEFRDECKAWIDNALLEQQAAYGGVDWPATSRTHLKIQ